MTLDKSIEKKGHRPQGEDGFTLVELLVVLAIIGLIAAVATPQVLRYLDSAKVDTTKTQIRNLESALELYYLDTGNYPTSEEGLAALSRRPPSATTWNGPYLKSGGSVLDGWNTPYHYESPASDKPFVVISYGRDKKAGGTGLDSDLVSN